MLAGALCILSFVVCYWMGKRSLGQGLVAILAVGYAYGIVRANLLTTFSHFTFDAGLLGLYFSQSWSISINPKEAKRLQPLRLWLAILTGWPLLLVLMPFQPLLVSFVGLRGNTFFLPIIVLGSRLKSNDLVVLSCGLAALNLVAFGFAGAEYLIGVPKFYPLSPVTQIIYASGDVAGGYFRIPAIFTSAAAYGGMMAFSLPYLIGLWGQSEVAKIRLLAALGAVAGMIGVLLSASRTSFIQGAIMLMVSIFGTRIKTIHRVILIVLILIVAILALSNERLQRFESLKDTDYVSDRIAGSVNRSFLEILVEYPMGNGLGGGGTSMPYFVQGQVRNPIGMENGYALILCELGVIGLLLWLVFIAWFLSRVGVAFARSAWTNARKMAWCLSAFAFATAWIGTGMLTSIPATVMLLLGVGWTVVPEQQEARSPNGKPRVRLDRPAYT
jgi:hypothetical protein